MNTKHVSTALQNAVTYLKNNQIITKDFEISEKTGYSPGSVSTYISGNTMPSKPFLKKFQEVFKLDLAKFATPYPEKKDEEYYITSLVNEDQAVYNLASSNKTLAESNKTIAEAHKVLAESNAELVQMIKGISSANPKTPGGGQAISPKVLELIAEAVVGKYKSKEEALAALHSKLFGAKGAKSAAKN